MDPLLDVLVVGAGQAGLAMGKALKDAGKSFVILEAEAEIGSQWKKHYDSLVLFTPRRYSALPGMPMPGDQKGCAGKHEFAGYLERYAKEFALPIVLDARVTKLRKEGDFIAETSRGTYRAKQAVIAAGYSQPSLPKFASGYTGRSLHSSEYRNLAQAAGKVLVVGAGNSGAQIALELSATHDVDLAMAEMPRAISPAFLGKSFYWWNALLGLDRIPTDSFIGKLLRRDKDYVVGKELPLALAKGSVTARKAVQAVSGREVIFTDGTHGAYDTVIWATGFVPDYSWIDIPGALTEERGVSMVPGLFYVGLRNQLSIFSGNIWGTRINTPFIMGRLLQ